MSDNVNHPRHYTQGGIECIDAIRAALTPDEVRGYCKGNVLKYVWRERLKNGTEDLRKAKRYIEMMSEADDSGQGTKADRDTSRYFALFGTPERAAKTVSAMCSHGIWSCDGCPLFDEGVEHCESELGDTPSLLEWLRGDA